MCISVFLLPPKDINECLLEPCENGGTCENKPGSYLCHCPPGFKGRSCEISAVLAQGIALFKKRINDDILYRLHRTTVEFYICVCKCVCAEQDGCESNPCLNGGVCRGYRRNYLCVCKDGFFGDQCQMCKWL